MKSAEKSGSMSMSSWPYSTVVFNSGASTDSHLDHMDDSDTPSNVIPGGTYSGGDLVLPEFGLIFRLRPGDMFFSTSACIEHFNTPLLKDDARISIVGTVDKMTMEK